MEEEKRSLRINGAEGNPEEDIPKLQKSEKKEPVPFIAGEINIPRTRDGKPLPELKESDKQEEEL